MMKCGDRVLCGLQVKSGVIDIQSVYTYRNFPDTQALNTLVPAVITRAGKDGLVLMVRTCCAARCKSDIIFGDLLHHM